MANAMRLHEETKWRNEWRAFIDGARWVPVYSEITQRQLKRAWCGGMGM
jgi:hypothetical protein